MLSASALLQKKQIAQNRMYLIFDTETTGLPKRWEAPVS